MKRLFLLAFTVLGLASCGQKAPEALMQVTPEAAGMDSRQLSKVDSVILQGISDGMMPGAVLCVVRDDKIAYLKAYGCRQVVPDIEEMTPDTLFDLASLSKCVSTTLCVMRLFEQGRIAPEDKVIKYIPDFAPWRDPYTEETVDITVRDLLTHASGLAPYLGVQDIADRYGEPCPDSTMRYIAKEARRNFRPGTDFMYSCLNFVTLQNIVQNVTGEPLCEYAQREIFDRLGLKQTCYKLAETRPELLGRVAPTTVQDDGLPLRGLVHDPLARRLNGGNSGNAGVFSTAEDLAVIAAAIFGEGEVGGCRLLRPETVRLMSTVPKENAPEVGRALGWDISSSHSHFKGSLMSRTRTLNHTGYTGTSIVLDLDSRTGVILLTNRCHPTDDGSLKSVRTAVSDIVAGAVIQK